MLADMTHPEPLSRWLDSSSSSSSSSSAQINPSMSRVVYAGFDPTASSLHIGNLLVLMVLRKFQMYGHKPICIVGGATGMIGDPSGRSTERNMISEEILQKNIKGITKDIRKFLVFEQEDQSLTLPDASTNAAPSTVPAPSLPVIPSHAHSLLLNNASWFTSISLLPFLRNIGKHFRLGNMLGKESVSSRLNSPNGMSFTEFCYQLLQAYDFLYLFKTKNVSIQIGGTDQWGNITAGVELIQREAAASVSKQHPQTPVSAPPQVFGLTLPLLTTSDGHKFGKSMGNAPIWLAAPSNDTDSDTPNSTQTSSPYELYQYFLTRTSDTDVIRFLRCFTDHSLTDIALMEQKYKNDPQTLCKILAESVTRLVHGESGLLAAQTSTAALFGGVSELESLPLNDFIRVFAGVPSIHLSLNSQVLGRSVTELAVNSGACKTKAEAKRLISQGGLYVNNIKVNSPDKTITLTDLLCKQRVCLLRSGKKKQFVIFCEPDPEASVPSISSTPQSVSPIAAKLS
jgi:tyrosyl-tRNA synthetase